MNACWIRALKYVLINSSKGIIIIPIIHWVFTGRTDVEAETPIFWPPDAKSWLIWKDPDAGRDWGQEEKGMTEDEMAGWHHGLDGCECEWTPGVGDGQGGLACCGSRGRKGSDMTERLNWTSATYCWLYYRKNHFVSGPWVKLKLNCFMKTCKTF